jgi:hypothetical protein
MRATSTQYGRPYRPRAVAIFNRVGPVASLDPGELVERAVHRSGAHYLGDDPVRERLVRLVESLEAEARLHRLGRLMARENLIRILVNRLRMEQLFDAQPEVLEHGRDDPVVIVGLQRSGTTLLHRLLACDPAFRVLQSWEAINPAPFPRPAGSIQRWMGGDAEPRVATAVIAQRAVRWLAPDFFAIHPIDARSPEEECLLFDYAFLGTVPEATYRVPSFSRWLESQDPDEAYRFLGRVLALLAWQRGGRQWLLKTPQHLEHLAALFGAFPRARVLHTHRDPARTLPSFCSMIAHAWGVFSDDVRPPDVVEHWGAKAERMVTRALAVRDGARERQFFDVRYRDLVARPLDLIRSVYAWLERPLRDDVLARMASFVADHPQHRHGRHVYDARAFGLDPAGIRLRFGDYVRRFAIEEEE